MFASKDVLFSAPSSYTLQRSLRFRSSASAYLNRTPGSAGNRQTWTWSAWVKRGTIGGSSNLTLFEAGTDSSNWDYIRFTTSDTLQIVSAISGTINVQLISTQVFRDPSAWYHLVVVFDTTNGTAANRVKVYVNGSQVTSFSTSTYPTVNYNGWIDTANAHRIGANVVSTPGELFDGYLTEINFIDGQALTPSSFGAYISVAGVWQPIKYTGTYGTNGFYLPFTNTTSTTTLGYDFSGNSNNWTTNNISLTSGSTYDSMTDVPTLTNSTAANYAVANPLIGATYGGVTYSEGNLKVVSDASTSSGNSYSTMPIPTSGKWYCEITASNLMTSPTGTTTGLWGLIKPYISTSTASIAIAVVSNHSSGITSSAVYANGTSLATITNLANGNIIGIAVDVGGGTVQFFVNGSSVYSGSYATSSGDYFVGVTGDSGESSRTYTAYYNFGQRPFTYTPPTGFVALNTYNLPTPTILNGANYMAATTWTGVSTSSAITINNSVNGISFQPDFVWGKIRSTTYNNQLYDSVRGTGKLLISNTTDAEQTNFTYGYISAFNSNGFTATPGATDNENWNQTSATYVAWQWQAGKGTTSSNTNGSITSTVSVNTTAGFSVVTYTGTGSNATVGHGLGVAPSMVIVKQRTAASTTSWRVWHTSIPATNYLELNTTAASQSGTDQWNSTSPSSSVFSLGTSGSVNTSGGTFVAYCFAAVKGYSAFGSYTGNGSTDGPFVYCGFRPRFIMVKQSSGAGQGWLIEDTARDTYNVTGLDLAANSSGAEVNDSPVMDILSNGFKMRNTYGGFNSSSATYIFMAFAENPFKYSLAR